MGQLPKEDERSDSRIWAEEIMPMMPKGWKNNSSLLELMRHYADSTNNTKLAFMEKDEEFLILNENLGTYEEGAWYSNEWAWEQRYKATGYGSTDAWGFDTKKYDYPDDRFFCDECNADLITQPEMSCGMCDDCVEEIQAYGLEQDLAVSPLDALDNSTSLHTMSEAELALL